MASLLTSLLTLARDGDKPVTGHAVSLARAAERAHERWAPAAELAGRSLELVGRGDATITASEEDLAILLDNLIENALRCSPSRVVVDSGRDGPAAWLAVRDEGPGLAAGEETRVFERFARGRAGGGSSGTGLGLAIVQTLARRWRGGVTLANRLGGGTRAEVRFPATARWRRTHGPKRRRSSPRPRGLALRRRDGLRRLRRLARFRGGSGDSPSAGSPRAHACTSSSPADGRRESERSGDHDHHAGDRDRDDNRRRPRRPPGR
jgi:hypothetical protein